MSRKARKAAKIWNEKWVPAIEAIGEGIAIVFVFSLFAVCAGVAFVVI